MKVIVTFGGPVAFDLADLETLVKGIPVSSDYYNENFTKTGKRPKFEIVDDSQVVEPIAREVEDVEVAA